MLNQSISTSLVDKDILSDSKFRHNLITNGEVKMNSELKEMLLDCDEFLFSVAFITKSGLIQIKHELSVLENSGIKGKIITGDYLGFTEPKALREIMKFTNIDFKMYSGHNLHSKGYFFKKDDIWTMYIGSSNLTQSALSINKEWNLKFCSYADGEIVVKALEEFNDLFLDCVYVVDVIDTYEEFYKEQKSVDVFKFDKKIIANKMQREALFNIDKTRYLKRGLLISATGTGKTILSALDVLQFNPRRVLFLVHQGNIAKKAMETFKAVIPNKSIGEYNRGEYDYIFATIQTICRDNHLHSFSRDYFDYIIIDEVHRSGAASYQKVIDYFTPDYLLGMTATPERSDDVNIFELFNHNIVHEIRLYDALEGNMLCPFHYFGIKDFDVDGVLIDDKSKFNDLVSESRVNHVLEKSDFYGFDGDFLSCLVFVSSIAEGTEFQRLFNLNNKSAVFLSGSDDVSKRESVISMFESGIYNYIISVNIFNEGIDIPCVNQIIMLRPTSSSIIYIQQLGRGLRKFENKEYVVVLDFIANYSTSFVSAKALSQNNSGEKDSILKFIVNPTASIKGSSTITFDKVSKQHLYNQVSIKKLSDKKQIREDYVSLCDRLNRFVMLSDFIVHGFTSPRLIVQEYGSVKAFYLAMKCDVTVCEQVEFLYKFFIQPKRVHEYEVISYLIKYGSGSVAEFNDYIEKKYGMLEQYEYTLNAVKHLSRDIFTSFSEFSKYDAVIILEDVYRLAILSDVFLEDVLKCQEFYLKENDYFKMSGLKVGQLYKKYESCLYGLVDYSNGHQVSGYNLYEDNFFGYINFDNENSFTTYDNKFLDESTFIYFSKNKKSLEKLDSIEYKMAQNSVKMNFFGRKTTSIAYYYLGVVKKVIKAEHVKKLEKGEEVSLIKYEFLLESPIRKDIYDYLVNKND